MLRHSTGFKLANQGVDTRSLQHYLGHKNIQHTVRYSELSPERFSHFWKGLALVWQILSGTGFPNQFFCDAWLVGFWKSATTSPDQSPINLLSADVVMADGRRPTIH
jgi:Phage integrase family